MARAVKGFVLVLAVAFVFSFGVEAVAKPKKSPQQKAYEKSVRQSKDAQRKATKRCKAEMKKFRKQQRARTR